ncbi:hypothetical protein HYH02_003375 [Chlamydomonas schloesseri]|uniref:BTB domain-containing protein n=1 Tax=Chlamydomonas schloesseri TaxID=2026947 RepID=A0A835WR32_9CHLO|nr:hypothetical protein HYH02_003375 [Chlamydomonas schloesseri]|eukprot:KAG2452352.1 hypothetical protein HYH02_003375 [Chlamydomonas schloesseri]
MRDLEGFCNRLAARRDLHPDIELYAFGKRYPAHRVILASQSTYFDVLLRWLGERSTSSSSARSTVRETRGDDTSGAQDGPPRHELALGEDVTQKGFEWILDYFYASPHTGITGENALDVLAAAHYLGVGPVQSACVSFLAQHLDPTNLGACLAWATRADHGEASDMLGAACRRLLALRLPAELGAWGPALPHIEPRCLVDMLGCDQLAVAGEFERYQLVKRVAELCAAASPAPAGTRRSSLDDQEPQQHQQPQQQGTAAAAGPWASSGGAARDGDSRRASSAGGAAADEGTEGREGGAVCGGRDDGEAALQRLLSSALNLPDDDRLARHLQLLRPCSPPAGAPTATTATSAGEGAGPGAAAAHPGPQLAPLEPTQPPVLQPPQLPALRLQPAHRAELADVAGRGFGDDGRAGAGSAGAIGGLLDGEPAAAGGPLQPPVFTRTVSIGSAPAGNALLCVSPSDCGSVLGAGAFGGSARAASGGDGGGGGMSTLASSSTTAAGGCSSAASARNTLRIWDSLGFGVSEGAASGDGDGGSGRARSSGGDGGVASLPSCDSVNLAAVYGSEGAGLEEDVVGTPLAEPAAATPATAPPRQQQQQQHSSPPAGPAPAINANTSTTSSVSLASSTGTTTTTSISAAASLAASRLALLCEAVRFEHLTVPQLMAVQAEGLVPPALLHAALWQRTCLDFLIHQRVTAGVPSSGIAAGGGGAAAASVDTTQQPSAGQQLQGQAPPGHRPFRMCWRLRCGALKKLGAGDMLQSEPQQYAGALWQVRLTCRDMDAARGHLGLYLGRHLAPAGGGAGSSAAGTGGAGGQLTPRRRDGGGAQRPPMPHPGYGYGYGQQHPHHRPGPRQQPHQHPQQPPPPRGNSPPQQQRPLAQQQQQQQPQPQPQQQQQPQAAAQPFFAFTDRQPALPSRCRLTVYQTDNTALSGRLCLGDSGDFESAFAAGGFFGAGRLLARADLEELPDEADVLVFVALQAAVVVPVAAAPAGAAGVGGGGAAGGPGGLAPVPEAAVAAVGE